MVEQEHVSGPSVSIATCTDHQYVSDDDCGSGDDDDDDIDYDDEGPSAYSVRVAWLDRNTSLALVFSSPSAKIISTSVIMTGGGDDDDDDGPSACSVRVA